MYCRHPAGGKQQSTGLLQLIFESPSIKKKKSKLNEFGFLLFGGDWGTRTLDLMRVKHAL